MGLVTKYIAGPHPFTEDKLIVASCQFNETGNKFLYIRTDDAGCRCFAMMAGSRKVFNKDRKWEMQYLSDSPEEAIGRLLGIMRREAEKARKLADQWDKELKAIEEQVTANTWRSTWDSKQSSTKPKN